MKFRKFSISPKIPTFNVYKLSRGLKQFRTNTAWGLDIGGHALKAVKIVQMPTETFIDEIEIIEYPEISVDVDSEKIKYIRDAIQAFLAKHPIAKADNVLVSVPGHLALSRFITIPPVDEKQSKDIVSYEVKQQIPFDAKEIVWDYCQLPKRSGTAEGLEIGLFASKRISLDNILTEVAPLKSRLTALQVSPLAIYNFILFDQQADGATIIINIETENTDLIIVDGMHFWIRSIPLFKVDADFVKEVNRSIEYYVSLSKETVQFKSILLMGYSFKNSQDVKFIAENFRYEVKLLKTLNNLKLSNKINPAYFGEYSLDLPVAIGLAIQGIGLGLAKTNLLPKEINRMVIMSRKKPCAIATLGCLSLLFAIQYGGTQMQINHLTAENNYHQKVLQDVKELEKKYKNTESIAQTSKSTLNLVASIDSSRYFWIEVLDKLLSSIPDNVSVAGIQSSWVEADTLKPEVPSKQPPQGLFQAQKVGVPAKPTSSKKVLLMGIKGESKEPSIQFIEEHILKPIQNLTIIDQKVPAFKNVEIVPGSCRQVDSKNDKDRYISFEIRWIVKSQDEVQSEIKSLSLMQGTPTASVKS